MQALTPGDGQDLVARFKRAWEGRDVDAAVALFREDAEYRFDPFEPPLVGVNAIRAYWNEAATSQVHIEFDAERVWVAGRTVLASWHVAFTRRATAERVRHRGFMTLELDEQGLVARFKEWSLGRTVGIDGTFAPEGPVGEA
ncbi:MAG: nuclear transport factor 2 family protein [Candidatus Limnocylindrales bacterium]